MPHLPALRPSFVSPDASEFRVMAEGLLGRPLQMDVIEPDMVLTLLQEVSDW